MVKKKKGKKKFKKLNKKDLKKVKGGVDIIGKIKEGLGIEEENGTHFVIDMKDLNSIGAGIKIKF